MLRDCFYEYDYKKINKRSNRIFITSAKNN